MHRYHSINTIRKSSTFTTGNIKKLEDHLSSSCLSHQKEQDLTVTSWVYLTQGVGIVISDVKCHQFYRSGRFVTVVCNRCSLANTSSVPTPAFYVHLHTIKHHLMLKHLVQHTDLQLDSSSSLALKFRRRLFFFPVRPVPPTEAVRKWQDTLFHT